MNTNSHEAFPFRLGIDIVQTERIEAAMIRSGSRFIERLLTPLELTRIGAPLENSERIAGIWAAKEAAVKALGTGFQLGITFHDIVILQDELGSPHYEFSGSFKEIMIQKCLRNSAVSISHCKTHAVAAAVLN